MKFNLKKFNDFFESNNYEQDINDFVIKLYNHFMEKDGDIMEIKISLLDLGFYEIEKDDIDDYEDTCIIDFYKLSTINKKIRPDIIKNIFDFIIGENQTDFFIDMATEDLKILIVYDEWKISNRRNKLNKLNNINE